MRKTKIIATIGPATGDEGVLREMIKAGVDVVRFNFSHDNAANHCQRAAMLAKLAKEMRYHVGFLGDLQGAKIRIGRFIHNNITLKKGQYFILDPQLDLNAGTEERVGLTYRRLYRDVSKGDELILDDGRLRLAVLHSDSEGILTEALNDAELGNNKGVHRLGGGLSAPSLTEKDMEDIRLAAKMNVDYLAISFPKCAQDIVDARKLLRDAGSQAAIIAKIERTEALHAIDKIIDVSDGVMIARGDLSIEIGDARLTVVQKELILKARRRDRLVITATEMLQSMIISPVPTRAEISDIANAVLDGSDALMLSAESAVGKHPVDAVATMSRICQGAESGMLQKLAQDYIVDMDFTNTAQAVTKAIALSAVYSAKSLNAEAIVALTESGTTPFLISRYDPNVPIYALTPNLSTCRKSTMYRGVYPISVNRDKQSQSEIKEALSNLKRSRELPEDSLIIITKGDTIGQLGGTNNLKIVRYVSDKFD